MFALVQGHTTSEFLKNLVRATKFRGRRKFKNIYPIHSRELRTPRTSSRLYFASSKEENVESPRERSSFSKTVLPLLPPPSLSQPRTPPPQGFLPPRVDFLGKVERVPLWAVHLVALPLHQTNRPPLLGETGIKDTTGLSLFLVASYFAQSRSKLCSRLRVPRSE